MTHSMLEPLPEPSSPEVAGERRMATVTPLRTLSMREVRDEYVSRRRDAGHARSVAESRQHSAGKFSAMERIDRIVDPGTFRELEAERHGIDGDSKTAGDGVVTGHAEVYGKPVAIFAQDFSVRGGSLGQAHANKILKLMQVAERVSCPVIGLYDGGGARIHEGALALDACGKIFHQIVKLSGVVPQISVILGPCAGAAAYAPALTDVVFMVRDVGMMYLTGPDVVEQVTGEKTNGQLLGGADVHGSDSGVATFVRDDEDSCLEDVRYLVSLLPSSSTAGTERLDTEDPAERRIDSVLDLVPADPKFPYDMRDLIGEVFDLDTFLEFHSEWATNVVCGLGRIDGWVVGTVANQPAVRAGVLDSPASEKAARFVSWCDSFNIPIVTFVDVPGFLPGSSVEREGVIRHGATLLQAYCSATSPRIQVIVRKAYGGAYIVMDSPATGSDLSYAWPTNEVAVMGAESAVEIIHRRRLRDSAEPEALRGELRDEYHRDYMHPHVSAQAGLVHEVIDPIDTRHRLAEGLKLLATKTGRLGSL